jgi:starch-binding outer membrane protein, SusD/RagB family
MRKLLSTAGCAALLLAGASCNSFLDPHPTDTLTSANFYKTQADALAAVNAAYGQLEYQYLYFFYVSDVSGDDIFATANFGTDGHQLADYTFDKTLSWWEYVWSNSYIAINRSNLVVDNVPGISMDTTLKKRVIGEAKFIRALNYFNMVRWFGDVPVVLHAATSASQGLIPRTPADSVYNLIINDLTAAAAVLPPSYSGADAGRATSGAALSLLAKVYLTQKNWALAAQTAGQVINSGVYQLAPHFKDPFTIALQFTNPETIFQVNYASPTQVAGVLGSIVTLFGLPEGYPGGDAYGLMQVNPATVNQYTATDTRGDHGSIMTSCPTAAGCTHPYVNLQGDTVYWSVPSLNHSGGAGAAFDKYLDETNTQNTSARSWEQQGNGWIVLRYADVLLMYAEAVNNGGPQAAMSRDVAYNMVAQRGDPSAPTVAGLSQQAFQDSLIVQRDKEFLLEGQRWFDLARWGVLDSVITVKTGQIAAAYPGETTQHGAPNSLFPIPLTEIQVNPKLTQNPGW